MPDPIATLLRVIQGLEQLGIPYCVGGSLASSFYGTPRATNDVDVVVALGVEQIASLVALLEDAFMIDPQAASAAVASKRSFNIIDFATLDKVDLFVATDQPWSRQQLQRRRLVRLSPEPDSPPVFVASPEDVMLSKLVWYRRGGETSDRQWLDIRSVLSVQADRLDWDYLRRWANELGVADLLTRATVQESVEMGEGDIG
jgi:hypothetical protein